jgi:hypothetical protein
MIVVEVGPARVITFLPLSCELSFLSLSLSNDSDSDKTDSSKF